MIGGRWIAIAGDVHGELTRLDALLARFERAASAEVALILQVGDLELPEGAPRLRAEVVFIGGNHDAPAEVAPGFTALGPASVVERHGVRIGGLSGTYHPRLSEAPVAPTPRGEHCTRDDVAALLGQPMDVLLLHEWPSGLQAGARGNPHARLLIDRLQPRWAFCGHRHAAFAGTLGTTRVRCLADVRRGGADAVAFLRLPDLVEAAPLEELETFRSIGERGRR